MRQEFHDRVRAYANGTAWLLLLGSVVGGIALAVAGGSLIATIAGVALAVVGGGIGATWVRRQWRQAGTDPSIRFD